MNDTTDVFKCLDANTGQEIWSVRHPAPAQFDFGNSPRATPMIHGELVYLFGASGHLHCVELATGKPIWFMDVRLELNAEDNPKWGCCSTPIIVDDKIIVNPGAKDASLVALECKTGKVLWKSSGNSAGYGSLITGTFGGRRQVVGHDLDSLGGWDVSTGKRLWKLVPPRKNDFNVPTPIQVGEQLLVSTENNGTRLYRFDNQGVLVPEPVAINKDLAPDTHSPVVVGDRVFGVWKGLICLDLKNQLKTRWIGEDPAFTEYAAIVGDDHRLLVISLEGELLLVDAQTDRYQLIGRFRVFKDERGVYSHPALVGKRLYLRGSSSLVCLEFP